MKTAREFLKENGALFKYYRNMVKHGSTNKSYPWWGNVLDDEKFSPIAISCSFHWAESNEGLKFWSQLDKKWLENLRQ